MNCHQSIRSYIGCKQLQESEPAFLLILNIESKKSYSSLEPPYDRKDFRQPMQFQTPHFQTRMTTVLKISTRMIWAISYGQYRMSHRRYIEPLYNLNSLLDFEISLK